MQSIEEEQQLFMWHVLWPSDVANLAKADIICRTCGNECYFRQLRPAPSGAGFLCWGHLVRRLKEMFKQEKNTSAYTCPECGVKLTKSQDLLCCQEHGSFFTYGPQLLVRAPHQNGKSNDVVLPWEMTSASRSR